MIKLRWDGKTGEEMHSRRYIRQRSGDLYHTSRWTRLSRVFRQSHPLCEECKRHGIIRPATCVDHIIPYPICKDRFFDRTNLQSLCDECNAAKGNRDKKLIASWKLNNNK